MKPYNAIVSAIMVDLSTSYLQEAAYAVGPAFVYELTVSRNGLGEAIKLLQSVNALSKDNPLSPYCNVLYDDSYNKREWSLQANGKCFWSDGP